MPTIPAELTLFLSSFSPLFVMFGLLKSFGGGWPSYVCYAVAVVSTAFLATSLRVWRNFASMQVHVARARHRDADAIAYVATYVVPFAALGVATWESKVALLGFLALVAVLYVRAHLFYVNPILSAIGYRLFEIETASGRVMLVLSRRKYIPVNSLVDVRTLSDYIFLDAHASGTPNSHDEGGPRS